MQMVSRFRGDAANGLRQMVATVPRADLERNSPAALGQNGSWVEVEKVEWKDDAAQDAFEVRMAGVDRSGPAQEPRPGDAANTR